MELDERREKLALLRASGEIGRRDHARQRDAAERAAAQGLPLPPVEVSAARRWRRRAIGFFGSLG